MQLIQSLIVISMLAASSLGQIRPAANVKSGQSPAAAAADLIFTDGFEAGSLTAWSSSNVNGGDLKASASAALRGGMGLQAAINDNNSVFVTDDTPNAEPRYRARFYFDPNTIQMAGGDTFILFRGFQGTSTSVVEVNIRMSSGSYQIRARAVNNGSGWTNGGWATISDAAHCIELDWRAASAAGKKDGGLTLWIDEAQVDNLTGLDNDTRRMDRARLGAVQGIDSGTRGSFYADAFESRRQTYIGQAGNTTSTPVPTTIAPTAVPPTATVQAPTPPASGDVKITYTASNEDFANPERGFMKQSSVFPEQSLSLNKISALQASDSLVWIYFRLDNYRDKLLDQNALNTIQTVFSTARSRGLKLVIRFVYNPGPGSTPDPNLANPDAPLDLVLQHISQIKPILMNNSDVIAVMQAGFVGHWGEWHSTKYLHPLESRRAIVDALLGALPQDRMIQLRYPRYDEMFYQGPLTPVQAFTGSDASRVGIHNDCFLEGTSDSGTYFSNTPQLPKQSSTYCVGQDEVSCWKGYVSQQGRFTPVGGETCSVNPPRTACTNAVQEMEALHFSFLNNGYKAEVLNGWSTGGCMDTIRRRLGYRLVLEDATLPTAVRAGGTMHATIRLANQGFASMYNPRPVYLVLRGTAGRYELPITNADPRRWESNQEQVLDITVNLPANIPAGNYQLALWLPDAAASLRNTPAYSVRFANANMWDAALGMNILTNTLQVLP